MLRVLSLALLVMLADDPSLKIAREHFAAGKAAFEAGDYETAIREFRAARDVKPSPLLDHNIGLAYERLGRLDLAIASYEEYLRAEPSAANRSEVEDKLRRLRERLTREGVYGTTSGGAPPPTATSPPVPAPVPAVARPPTPAGGATAPAGGGAVAPSERPKRFAAGLRLGPGTSGGFGAKANVFGVTARLRSPSALGGLFLRFPFQGAFQGEVSWVVQDFALVAEDQNPAAAGKMSASALRAKAGYVWPPWERIPLEIGAFGGIDVNSLAFTVEKPQAAVAKSVGFGLWLEVTVRWLIRARHELMVSPVCLHFQGAQNTGSTTVGDSRAATALDLDHRASAYSFELGYAYRF